MTESSVKTRRGVALYDKNPFMVEMTTKTRRVTNKRGDMMLVNNQTGEIQSNIAGFWEAEEVDSTKFVKLFVQGVKALKELTGAGTKVFEVLYLRVQENIGKDRVFMALSEVDQALTPMSEATYTRGMRELIEKGFIAATPTQGWYWLNPSFVWNGDRLAFVKEYRKASGKPKALEKDTRTLDLFSDSSTGQTDPALPPAGALSQEQGAPQE
ncbi:firmicute plasmid replication protein [Necator americanus]|uniref:Firmicute plasmid replication protein n=1 Tax=Necator americanus TaxID=51031 RepID=W2TCP0_NECAM|nr:firmicute plasmid replication protein [Necator americanus]ETN79618.1 firmicute plasmid replication protein [Necator americanus]